MAHRRRAQPAAESGCWVFRHWLTFSEMLLVGPRDHVPCKASSWHGDSLPLRSTCSGGFSTCLADRLFFAYLLGFEYSPTQESQLAVAERRQIEQGRVLVALHFRGAEARTLVGQPLTQDPSCPVEQ